MRTCPNGGLSKGRWVCPGPWLPQRPRGEYGGRLNRALSSPFKIWHGELGRNPRGALDSHAESPEIAESPCCQHSRPLEPPGMERPSAHGRAVEASSRDRQMARRAIASCQSALYPSLGRAALPRFGLPPGPISSGRLMNEPEPIVQRRPRLEQSSPA